MEGGPPDFPPGYSCPAVLWIQRNSYLFRSRGSHALWPAFPCRSTKDTSSLMLSVTPKILLPSVWPLPRSLATTSGISVDFFSSPYLDVSVQEVPSTDLWIQSAVHEVCSCGLPHSDICGSSDMCSSPQLFAACHVLLRLPVPRHPPYALLCLAFSCIRASRASYGSPWLPYMALMYGLSLSKNFSCFSLSWLLG